MLHSGTQGDFSKAASTLPVSAAQGAREGSWPSPGQVFEPRDHFPVVSIRQKTHAAFFKGWEQKQTAQEDSPARARRLTRAPGSCQEGSAVSPTRNRLGARAGSRAGRMNAPCLATALVCRQERAECERLAGAGDAPRTGANFQQTGFAPRAGPTPRRWFTSPYCVCINRAIAIWGHSFTQDTEDLAATKQML